MCRNGLGEVSRRTVKGIRTYEKLTLLEIFRRVPSDIRKEGGVARMSECKWYRRAAVAYRFSAGERWRRRAVWSLLLQSVRRLQLMSVISHQLAQCVVVMPTVAAGAIAAP